MKKKRTGLISSLMAETASDTARHEALKNIVSSLKKEKPDFVQNLRRLSKAELIDCYLSHIAGDAYDDVGHPARSRDTRPADIKHMCDALLRAAHRDASDAERDEASAAVLRYKDAEIADAGRNIPKIIEVVDVAAKTLARIEFHQQLKSHKSRPRGGRTRAKQLAEQKRTKLKLIKEKEAELTDKIPKHKMNKEIAKATGLETDYVRKARKVKTGDS